MKKLILIILSMLIVPVAINAHILSGSTEESEPTNKVETKFSKFTSTYGTFVQLSEYDLPNFKLDGGWINYVKIQVFNDLATGKKTAFLRLRSGYANRIESIAYPDLIKILEAIPKLKEIAANAVQQGQYMETKFITEDGFQIGFWMENNKITWYMTVDYQNRTFKKGFDFEKEFQNAKEKMEELIK